MRRRAVARFLIACSVAAATALPPLGAQAAAAPGRTATAPAIAPRTWPAGYPRAPAATGPGYLRPRRTDPRRSSAPPARAPTAAVPGTGSMAPTTPTSAGAAPQNSPTALGLFKSTSLVGVTTGGFESQVAEPDTANSGNTAFYTANWFAAYSTDAGSTFNAVDPFTKFSPPLGQRFCCDQRVVYDPGHGIFLWLLQYYNTVTGEGPAIDRLAVATPAQVASGAWTTYDLNPALLTPTLTGVGVWFDYPDLAVGSTYLYFSTNVFDSATPQPNWLGSAIMRFDLATLAAHGAVSPTVYDETPPSGRFNFTPVTGATTTMYFASQDHFLTSAGRTYADTLVVYSWPDASGSPTAASVVVTPWFTGDSKCAPNPSGVPEWCGQDDGRIQSGWLSGSLLSFIWDAAQDPTGSKAGSPRAYPYLRVVRLNLPANTIAEQPDIFSPGNAWAYGSASVDARGDYAVSAQWGSSTVFPSSTVLVRDAVSGAGYSSLPVRDGAAGPASNRWGDFLTVAPTSPASNSWLATSYTIQTGPTVEPRFLWFGRLQDDPFQATVTGINFSATVGVSTGSRAVATFTSSFGSAGDYTASIDWGDGTAPSAGTVTGSASPFTVSGSHTYTATGSHTVTTTVTDPAGVASSGTGNATIDCGTTCEVVSTAQSTLTSSDGLAWQDLSRGPVSLTFIPAADGVAVLGGNADLFTSTAGYNQDLGITVSCGASCGGGTTYPTTAGQPEAWKESGGFAGTFSPNAAFVQTVIPVKAGVDYSAKLQWKTNVNAPGVTIFAGAGASAPFSPSRLTVRLVPTSEVSSAATTSQKTLNAGVSGVGSDGARWADLGVSLPPVTPSADSKALIGGNADLWTSAAGYNQDLGIMVNGTLVAWKESGGFAGTFSPNAAFVQTVVPMTHGVTYDVKLVWKTNRPDPSAISAGAGPIGGKFSPTRLTLELVAATPANLLQSAFSTAQSTLTGSDGVSFAPMNHGPGTVTVTPSADTPLLVSGNADLWTFASGYNQDLGLFVSVDSAPDQLVAWKESGGFAGTFSPNAAFVQAVYLAQAGHTYVFSLKWKTNVSDPNAIAAGAGPYPSGSATFSPTTLTVQIAG